MESHTRETPPESPGIIVPYPIRNKALGSKTSKR
jgi:hypothetical protein